MNTNVISLIYFQNPLAMMEQIEIVDEILQKFDQYIFDFDIYYFLDKLN